MGLFGKKFDTDRMIAGLSGAQATLAGDYGTAASIWGNYRDDRRKDKAAQAKAQQALELELGIRSGLEKRGYAASDIDVLMANPETAAALVKEALQTRQFDSGGGSLYDPLTKSFTQAPSERQVGRSIVRTDPTGNSKEVFTGIEPVAVQPGGKVYGFTNSGPVSPAQIQPTADDADEWEYDAPMQGGAPQVAGARPFRSGLFGRR